MPLLQTVILIPIISLNFTFGLEPPLFKSRHLEVISYATRSNSFLSTDPKNLNENAYEAFNNSPVYFIDKTGKAPRSATDILVNRFGHDREQLYLKLDRKLNKGRFGTIYPERFDAFQHYRSYVGHLMEKSLPNEITQKFLQFPDVPYRNLLGEISWDVNKQYHILDLSENKVPSLKTQSYEQYVDEDVKSSIQEYINDREYDFWESACENSNLEFYEAPSSSPHIYEWYGEEFNELYMNEQFQHVNVVRGFFNSMNTESVIEEYELNNRIYELSNSKTLSYLHGRQGLQSSWLMKEGQWINRPYLHFIQP